MPDPFYPRRGVAAANAPGSAFQLAQAALVVVAVLYFAREVLIPLVLAVLFSFVLAPVVRLLRRLHVPRSGAVLATVLLMVALLVLLGGLLARQLTQLTENLPTYQATIEQKLDGLHLGGGVLDRLTVTLNEMGRGTLAREGMAQAPRPLPGSAAAEAPPLPVEVRPPSPTPWQTARDLLAPLLGPLATAGIVIILVVFILLYREDLRDRLIRLVGARDLHRTMAAMDDAAYRLSRFFLAQVALNSGYGVFIAAGLWFIGIPNPILWGAVAGLMRFVPFIGSYIAAAFPLLLALAVDPGWGGMLWVLALFGLSEPLMGQVLEPWIFGHSTGLSPIAVIAAATFWTWLWGPVGLLLSVPLTVCLVVLGRHVEQLEFLEVALGDSPPLDPEEIFYQRGLAGDADALAEHAARGLEEMPLAIWLDRVAMPALRMAQEDSLRGALATERLETLRHSLDTLVDDLREEEEAQPGVPEGEERRPPPPWQAPGAVLCIPGRGPLDTQAAAMLAQVLERRGFGVQIGGAAAGPAAPPRLICLCLLEGGSSAAAARYQLRRQRRRLPGVETVALAWHAMPDGGLAAALRAEGANTPLALVSTLEEAAEAVMEAAERAPGPLPMLSPGETPPPPAA